MLKFKVKDCRNMDAATAIAFLAERFRIAWPMARAFVVDAEGNKHWLEMYFGPNCSRTISMYSTSPFPFSITVEPYKPGVGKLENTLAYWEPGFHDQPATT